MMPINAFSRGSRAAQQLLSRYSVLRANVVLGYGVGLVAFILAIILRFLLNTMIPNFPFITFIPAVIITAFLAGSRAGAFCAALCFLSTWYWFVDPMEPFSTSYNSVVGLGLFAFNIAVDIAIVEVATRAVHGLAAKQAQLNTIIETVPLGLVMAEFPSGKIVGGNRYIEEKFGHPVMYSPDIHSYGEWIFFHEDGSRVDGHEFPLAAMMLRGEDSPSIEVQYQRGNGSKGWTRILGRPVRDDGGNITGGVVAFIDIDEQRKSQAALEAALRSKELLFYEVNHRVKNSLHLVNSFLLLEASKISDSVSRSAVMAARTKVDLIARLHQILYINGIHDSVNLKSVLEEIVHDLVFSAGRSDVNLELGFSGDPMLNIRQASPLVLAVNEIITNSLKYGLSSKQPKLTVSAIASNGEVTLAIRDNGPGISVATTEKEPGLGSQILEGLVAQMRGKSVHQSDSSGTSIVLTIPIKPYSSEMRMNS